MSNDYPAWGYRRASDGSIEAKIFETGRPEGWADSPSRVDDEAPKPKRGRPRKSE